MTKVILIILIFSITAQASVLSKIPIIGSLFGGKGKTSYTLDTGKKETTHNYAGDVEENKTKISALEKWKNTVESNITANVTATVQSNINAEVDNKIAAYDKSQRAGRDMYTINKNDGKMIGFIVAGIFSFSWAVAGGLLFIIYIQIKGKTTLAEDVAKYKQESADFKKHIDNLTVSKNNYKQRFEEKFINGNLR